MQSLGYQSVFSDPVRQQRLKLDGSECLRGRAGGTALCSSVPCRACRYPLDDKWRISTRLLHTVVQLGVTHVQLFILYGATRSIPNAMDYNEELATEAINRSKLLPLPAMFVGDFNCEPKHLEAFQPLFQEGYRPLESLYEALYASPMPFTCKDATNVDTAVIAPALIPFVTQAEALFKKPPITQCNPECDRVGKVIMIPLRSFLPSPPKDKSDNCAESSLRVRPGRKGDYDPPTEFFAITTKRQVRQLRRIQSLWRQCQKITDWTIVPRQRQYQLQQEWTVVIHDTCLGLPFAAWAQSMPELGPLPQQLPDSDLLYCIYQLFKFHVDQQVEKDGKLRYQMAKWATFSDKKYGHSKKAFATARGKYIPPIHSLAATFDEIAICMTTSQDEDGTSAELAVEDPRKFHLHFPVQIQGTQWWIQNLTDHSLVVHCHTHQDLPEEVPITQVIEHFDKATVFHHLNEFWGKYWQRDDTADEVTPADQHLFQDVLSALPVDLHHIQVEQLDLERWLYAIRTTKSQSAPGVDGVRAAELQMLPDAVIRNLMEVYTICPEDLHRVRSLVAQHDKGASLSLERISHEIRMDNFPRGGDPCWTFYIPDPYRDIFPDTAMVGY
eukprot:s1400_g5.t1